MQPDNMLELGIESIPLWPKHFSTVCIHVSCYEVIDLVNKVENEMDTKQKENQMEKPRNGNWIYNMQSEGICCPFEENI